MKLKKTAAVAATICLLSGTVQITATCGAESDSQSMRDITTMELVQDMGIGINLGNTFESFGEWIATWGDGTPESYETAWGSPVITQEVIQGYADAGFGTLRIPVAWSNMMEDDYTISSEYLEAVRETVDWALDTGMYVVINLHYDGGWMSDFPTDTENCMEKYSRIWEQVSEAFADYGDYLIFESQNEELGWSTLWNQYSGSTTGKADSYGLVNEINQTFVDIVRSSGGNNAQRHLLISGYNTDISLTCDDMFEMPDDPANRLAVSVHYYIPSTFAILEEDASWGTAQSTWGTASDINTLNKYMDMLKTTFVDEGVPVIISEYGCPKNNKDEESIRLYLSSVCEATYSRGMCPILWDITDLHYDRTACEMTDSTLLRLFHAIIGIDDSLLGDVNSDGTIDAIDASLVLAEYTKLATNQSGTFTDDQELAADVNGDNTVDAVDASKILAYYAAEATGKTPSWD